MQGFEDALPDAFLAPPVKALEDRVILAEAFRKVRPGGAGACDPEDSVDEAAVVLGRAPGVGGFAGE